MIRTFQGITPTIPQSCFIEETAVVIGDVVMGDECSAWFHAVIRGDVNYIRIGHRTNVQDLCMLHVTHDTPASRAARTRSRRTRSNSSSPRVNSRNASTGSAGRWFNAITLTPVRIP